MKIFIDGIQKSSKEVAPRDFGFTPPNYNNLSSYRLEFPRSEFNEVFEKDYQQLVNELKEDDMIMGEFDPPYEGATDYPSLEELHMLTSEQLTEWLDYLFIKIIFHYFPWNDNRHNEPNYLIVSIDKIKIVEDTFIITGQAEHRYLWSQFNRSKPFDYR